MQRTFVSLLQLAGCLALVACLAANAQNTKADPTGTWKWSAGNPNGQARETILKLKLAGDTLTGTISDRTEIAIEAATFKGADIAFQVVRRVGGNKVTNKYSGTISGNTIKGKFEFDRDGKMQSRDWEAKRDEAKPK